jgi:glycosyltransferase involved in cell wall biosynthesis
MTAPGLRVLSVGNQYPPQHFGGYELVWESAVRHWRAAGHSVRVLASDYRHPAGPVGGAPEGEDVHRDLRWYWRDHAFPRLALRERAALERHNAAVLARHLDEFRPDVVAWWGMGGMSLTLVERIRRAGLPAVGVVGDEWLRWGLRADGWLRPLRSRPWLGRIAERIYGLPGSVVFDGAATWLFNSAAIRASAPRLSNSAVAHPGIDEALFRPAPAQPWRWRLLYLGRLDERKGIHLAVDALRELPPGATLTIQGTGDAEYERRLRTQATEHRLDERVVFSAEPRDRLPAVYAAADVLVFPVQWEEPWGLVPLEAMAVGRPVVASGTGGSREYLRHEENCLVYEPRDSPAALAAAITRLAGDPALRERFRRYGFEAAAHYTERAYNDAIEGALAEAARANGPSA